MVDVASYIKTLSPKGQRSSLKKFEKEILQMRDGGFSLQQIADFLEANGQKTTLGNLSKFIKKTTVAPMTGQKPAPKVTPATGPESSPPTLAEMKATSKDFDIDPTKFD